MAEASDLIDYFKLDIQFHAKDHFTTIETIEKSDRARGLRQMQVKKIWKREREIGHGSFGSVWLERCHEHEGRPEECRAVKEILKKGGTNMSALPADYRRELVALGRLSKRLDLFVDFHGWYENDRSVYLVMEYFEQSDLVGFIEKGLTERDAHVIGSQLLEGLAILHDQKWAHRDLKPTNIFVVEAAPDWWVKIGDFGISKRLREGEMGTSVGTYGYMAPEIEINRHMDSDSEGEGESHKPEASVAVDMWSLGCVLYQILTQKLPFPRKRDREKYCRNKSSFPREELVRRGVSQEGCDFIQKLVKVNPLERLTAKAALRERWIPTSDDLGKDASLERPTIDTINARSEPPLGVESHSSESSTSAEATEKAPVAPAQSSADESTTQIQKLQLDEQSISEPHQQILRETSSHNSRTQEGSQSGSASFSGQDFVLVSHGGREVSHQASDSMCLDSDTRAEQSVVRTQESPSPQAASTPRRELDPRLGIALWNFVKADAQDLSLQQFDIVHDISKRNEDWWHGEKEGGQRGIFPSNYIGQTRLQADALFDFEKDKPKDINMAKGERITNISISTRSWWTGTNTRGERGFFPGNYVKLDLEAIKEELGLERHVSNGHPRRNAHPPGPNPRHESTSNVRPSMNDGTRYVVGRAQKDYQAPDGTMVFERGELITDIQDVPSSPDRLLGTNAANKRGEFPRDLVEIAPETVKPLGGFDHLKDPMPDDFWLAHSRMPVSRTPRSGLKAIVVRDYLPRHPVGDTLAIGDELVDVERSTLTWWFGWHVRDGTRITFPKYMVQLQSDDEEQSGDDKTAVLEPTARPAERQSSRRQGLFERFTNRMSEQLSTSRSR